MLRAHELDRADRGLSLWQAYDPKCKADLFSTALETPAGTYLVDPIPLGEIALTSLRSLKKPVGIFITNGNHVRAAAEFARSFSVPILAHESLRGGPDLPQATWLQDGQIIGEGLTVIAIDGAPVGEIAIHYAANGGSMIFGDALINFEPYGFSFLPAKYCENSKLMQRSQRKLLDYVFDRMLFAHGTPILSNGHARLEELLNTVR
jgi:hypothetical protein